MRAGRLLLCSFAVLGLALATPTKDQCENCKSAFSKIALPGGGTKDKVERQIATLLRSDKLNDEEVNVFKGLPGKDTETMVTMISEGSTAEDVCRNLMGCGVEAAQQGGDSDNEKGASAHAGTSEVLDSVALAELAAEASADEEGASGNNSTNSNSTMFTGGFAWDKHDFDVANNKGGDVKVEINLAAPDTPDSPFVPPAEQPEEELSEIVPLLQEMISQKEEVNPIQLMEMMKDMMLSMRPPEPEQINVTEIIQAVRDEMAPPPQQDMSVLLKGIADVIKDSPGDTITHETKVVYPPAPPQADAASIISSFGTTMSAIEAAKAANAPMGGSPQQPFNVPEFMHEMKEMVEANKAPPAPPAGADQGLVDLVKETMEELKQMRRPEDHTTVVNPPMPATELTPPPPPTLPSGEPPAHPNSPFPTAPQGPGEEMPESVKEYIQQAIAQARPALMPELPKYDEQKKEVEELKELLRAHAVDVQRPIVLPPPAPQPAQTIPPPQILLPPPPPPSALAPGHDEAKIAKMVADLMPAPQRIPAPPTISVAVPATKDCCSDPPEGDDRPEEVRCPRINGIKRPKCKRNLTPPGMKKDALTTEMRCTDGKCDDQGDEEDDKNANSVADPNWQKMEVPEGMPANLFNPAKLMKVLCPGGICPEQKDLEPKLTQWPKMRTHKAMAEG